MEPDQDLVAAEKLDYELTHCFHGAWLATKVYRAHGGDSIFLITTCHE